MWIGKCEMNWAGSGRARAPESSWHVARTCQGESAVSHHFFVPGCGQSGQETHKTGRAKRVAGRVEDVINVALAELDAVVKRASFVSRED
jgi:hypothetical protein